MLINPNNPDVTQSGAEINVLVQGPQRKDDTLGSYVIPAVTNRETVHLRANTNVFAIVDSTVSYSPMVIHPSYDGQRIAVRGKNGSVVCVAKTKTGVSTKITVPQNTTCNLQYSDVLGWLPPQMTQTGVPLG